MKSTRCEFVWNPGTWPYVKRCENNAQPDSDFCSVHLDPELVRLLAKEEEIERRLRAL
jgi:hypothetical protein